MAHCKKWTKEEERVLLDQIKRSPDNLTRAYKRASELLGRTEYACRNRWVKHLSKDSTCFAVIGRTCLSNRKINRTSSPTTTVPNSIWLRIKKLLHL